MGMYVYAFNNPDMADNGGYACYATDGDNFALASDINGGKNVTKQFETWFKFGFILNMCNLVIGLLQLVHFLAESEMIGTCWMCLGTPLSCGALAWFITGMVFRWRHIGKVCSGEYVENKDLLIGPLNPYLWNSGKFMEWYFYLCFGLCILGCVCACCAGIFVAVSGR